LALARISQGKQDVLELGNLNAKRDWGFAGDYVEGMWRMLQQPEGNDYILATGITHTVREFIEHVARALEMELVWEGGGETEVGKDHLSGKVVVRVDPQFYRPTEVDLLLGSPQKAGRILGWAPRVGFEELAVMMAHADRERVTQDRVSF
jgi:GDPmannose 4,6-dehydratase